MEEARAPVAYIPEQARIETDSDWQLVAAGLDEVEGPAVLAGERIS
jgi:hypothetical protein